ncbi:hypothetical protein IWQ61_003783 [Dispira simplex]|nr:hypothetical protein IWQ61_003783 [Dispira simplex]
MRKIKCGRERPTCSSCRNRSRQCLYSPTAAQQRRARKQLANQRPTIPLPIMPQGSSIPSVAIQPQPVANVMENQTMQVFIHQNFPQGTSGPSFGVAAHQGTTQGDPVLGQSCSPGHGNPCVSVGYYTDSTLPSSPESQDLSQFTHSGNVPYWNGLEGNPLITQFMHTSLWDSQSTGPKNGEPYPMAADDPMRAIPRLEKTPPSSDEVPLPTLAGASLLSDEPPLSSAHSFRTTSQHTSPAVEVREVAPKDSVEMPQGKPIGRSLINDTVSQTITPKTSSRQSSYGMTTVGAELLSPQSQTAHHSDITTHDTGSKSSVDDSGYATDKTVHWWRSLVSSAQKLPDDDPAKVLFSRLTNSFFSGGVDLSSVPVSTPAHYCLIPRPLYVRSDLFFHSEVILHLINLFCRVLYPENQDLHYHRILVRHVQGFVDRSFIIAIMMIMAPMSNHLVFRDSPLRHASTYYHKRLVPMLPSVLESNSLDSTFVLGVLSEYELGRGHTESGFSLSTIIARKLQQWRVHILDHPSPPSRLCKDQDVPDLATATDPLLRENYRNVWYSCMGRDILGSLVFGHLPGIHIEDMHVNKQMSASQYLDLTHESLADPHSPFYTDPKYPTFIMRPLSFHYSHPKYMDLRIITHRVAEIRYYRDTDLMLWFRERTALNQKLEEWAQRNDIDNELPLVELQDMGHIFHYREYVVWRIHFLAWYYVTLIFLNYPGEISPWPFSPREVIHQVERRWNIDFDWEYVCLTSPQSLYPASPDSWSSSSEPPSNPLHEFDPTGEVFIECSRLCWEGVQGLYRTFQRSLTIPSFFHNTLFVGAFYAAGVICINYVQSANDPTMVEWARNFVEEIIDILLQVGELWVYNLEAVRNLRQLLEVKSLRKHYITLTVKENSVNMV